MVVGVGVVEVAGPGVDLTSREDALAVAKHDEVTHPAGRVVLVDRIASLHVQHGLDDDLVVADPVPDLGEGGGPELLDLADGDEVFCSVDLESRASTRAYTFTVALPDEPRVGR